MTAYEQRFLVAEANLLIQEKSKLRVVAETLDRGLMPPELEYLASELCDLATQQRVRQEEREGK